MHRPILFIARSWHGHGGMQRLNRDVVRHVGGSRAAFLCIHPDHNTIGSLLVFCIRSLITAAHWRGKDARIHLGDAAVLPLGVMFAWLGGMKLSVTACGLDVIYPNRFYQMLIRRCLRSVDHVICISAATAEKVRKRGVLADRITIIPCGIDLSPMPESTERSPHLLLTVGRLVRRKGVAWFLKEVFPRLLAENSDLHYCIVGNGPDRRCILSIIRKLRLQNSVTLMTNASDQDRLELMRSARLFIAPNIAVRGDMEGFGIVCLEAAAAGLPVAAARIEGLQDAVIDGETGRFFASGNAGDCARVITQMIRDPLKNADVHSAVTDLFAWSRLAPLYHHVFDA